MQVPRLDPSAALRAATLRNALGFAVPRGLLQPKSGLEHFFAFLPPGKQTLSWQCFAMSEGVPIPAGEMPSAKAKLAMLVDFPK